MPARPETWEPTWPAITTVSVSCQCHRRGPPTILIALPHGRHLAKCCCGCLLAAHSRILLGCTTTGLPWMPCTLSSTLRRDFGRNTVAEPRPPASVKQGGTAQHTRAEPGRKWTRKWKSLSIRRLSIERREDSRFRLACGFAFLLCLLGLSLLPFGILSGTLPLQGHRADGSWAASVPRAQARSVCGCSAWVEFAVVPLPLTGGGGNYGAHHQRLRAEVCLSASAGGTYGMRAVGAAA